MTTAEQLTERLNSAALAAGRLAGYRVEGYTDQTDSYADYCGFTIASGPDEDLDRAYAWLVKAVKQLNEGKTARNGVSYYNELRTVTEYYGTPSERKVTFVCWARVSLGD